MFVWSTEQIRFLRDASAFTPFNEALAEKAARCFSAEAHVCDAGCGLGYLSIALAERCARVTAVDAAPEALAVLREHADGCGVLNVTVLEADAFALPRSLRFDGMVFCFFGGTVDILRCVRTHCRSKAVLFRRNGPTHRFTVRETPLAGTHTFEATCAALDARDIPYHSETFALEMGQPFRSLEDAARFFRLHGRGGDETVLRGEALRERLVETGSAAFPYFLSANRSVGMIVLNAADVPAPRT